MKKNWFFALLGLLAMLSCSTDGEESDTEEMGVAPLTGIWNLTDATFEDNDSLNFIDEVIEVLAGQDCFLSTFTFNEGGTGTFSERFDNLQQNAGPGGLMIDCPTESNDANFTWSLEGDQLTIQFENEEEQTVTIVLDGDRLTIDGAVVDPNNLDGVEAVFTRE